MPHTLYIVFLTFPSTASSTAPTPLFWVYFGVEISATFHVLPLSDTHLPRFYGGENKGKFSFCRNTPFPVKARISLVVRLVFLFLHGVL